MPETQDINQILANYHRFAQVHATSPLLLRVAQVTAYGRFGTSFCWEGPPLDDPSEMFDKCVDVDGKPIAGTFVWKLVRGSELLMRGTFKLEIPKEGEAQQTPPPVGHGG